MCVYCEGQTNSNPPPPRPAEGPQCVLDQKTLDVALHLCQPIIKEQQEAAEQLLLDPQRGEREERV